MQLSIIIPVYNAEEYIEQAVNSVLCQDYDEFELILINDGSCDKTYEILERLHKLDKRIIVVQSENHGVSHARNMGIDRASGDYIMFMDSDDCYVNGAFTEIVDELKKFPETEVLCYGYQEVVCSLGEVIEEKNHSYGEMTLRSKEEINQNILPLIKNEMFGAVWSKVYKSSLIKDNNLKMQENLYIGEDFCFNLSVIKECSNFRAITTTLYLYKIQNVNSIIRKYNKNKFEQMYLMHQIRREFINQLTGIENEQKRAENRLNYVRICMSCLMDLSRKECTMRHNEKIKYAADLKSKEKEKFNKRYIKFYSINQRVIYTIFSIVGARGVLLTAKMCFYLKFYLKLNF